MQSMSKFKLNRRIAINSAFFVQDLPDKNDEKQINRFQIVNSNKSFVVYAENAAAKAEWIKDFFSCVEEVWRCVRCLLEVNSHAQFGFLAVAGSQSHCGRWRQRERSGRSSVAGRLAAALLDAV